MSDTEQLQQTQSPAVQPSPFYLLPLPLAKALANYLSERPYKETAVLIAGLDSLRGIKIIEKDEAAINLESDN